MLQGNPDDAPTVAHDVRIRNFHGAFRSAVGLGPHGPTDRIGPRVAGKFAKTRMICFDPLDFRKRMYSP